MGAEKLWYMWPSDEVAGVSFDADGAPAAGAPAAAGAVVAIGRRGSGAARATIDRSPPAGETADRARRVGLTDLCDVGSGSPSSPIGTERDLSFKKAGRNKNGMSKGSKGKATRERTRTRRRLAS